jgi:ADP-ribosylglycohydrolase
MPYYSRIFESNFASLTRDEIKSTGYVVDTLEAALWCLMTTTDYKSCVLKAVNLGEDTDTVAAVAGGLAGALYGYDSIQKEWRDTLIKRDYIEELCKTACNNWLK